MSAPTPSRYRLPQQCSPDRQRARRATLELQRQTYLIATDDGPGNPAEGFRLPIAAAVLPSGEDFDVETKARLLAHKAVLRLRSPLIRLRVRKRPDSLRQYRRLLGWLPHPTAVHTWRSDAEFARQRLTGTNPMALRRCQALPGDALAAAADRVLGERYHLRLNTALDAGRLYATDYADLLDARIQRQVAPGAWLAAPTCLFVRDDGGALMPLAIQLAPRGADGDVVVTPLDPLGHWLLARCHAQAADGHYHEAIHHLLETHMVSEVFALCTARQLHPDHPLHQLLAPHFEGTLAINYLARHDLLSPGGPLDLALAAGVGGALDLARIAWSRWSFSERRLDADLAARGLDDPAALPGFWYRDDGRAIWDLLHDYVSRVLGVWYRSDQDVHDDVELRAWCEDLRTVVPGFPRDVDTRAALVRLATDIIFRASAQHSAVNNGQFEAYGFIPNVPGVISAPPPRLDEPPLSDQALLRALNNRDRAAAQLGMAWVLSEPTHRSLLMTGSSPAFTREMCPVAYEATLALRRRLVELGEAIAARNRRAGIAYTYLHPDDVARSTAV